MRLCPTLQNLTQKYKWYIMSQMSSYSTAKLLHIMVMGMATWTKCSALPLS